MGEQALFADWVFQWDAIDPEALLSPTGEPLKLLCCLGGLRCSRECEKVRRLCSLRWLPVYRICMVGVRTLDIVPAALGSDLWLGYLQGFIYAKQVRWIECACASAYWNGLVVFRIDGARGHLMEAPLGRTDRTFMVRGHLLSFLLDWLSAVQELQRASVDRQPFSLPHIGAVLATMVQAQVSSAAVGMTKYLKQACVRAEIVAQLARMLNDRGHVDHARLHMVVAKAEVSEKLPTMARHGGDGSVQPGVVRVVGARSKFVGDAGLNPDKNATPPEPHAEANVALQHSRPQIIASQRHSDIDRCPNASQAEVFAHLSCESVH